MMTYERMLLAALAAGCATLAQAGVSEEEAKQVGTTLTPFGAEVAGNKEGSIPEYKGGLTAPPANYVKGSNIRPDPFPNEKPLFSITVAERNKMGVWQNWGSALNACATLTPSIFGITKSNRMISG